MPKTCYFAAYHLCFCFAQGHHNKSVETCPYLKHGRHDAQTRLPDSSSKDWQSSAVRSKGPLSEITANESNMAAGQEEENLAERQRQGQEHWMVKGVVAQNIQKWAERDQFSRTSSVESEDGGQGGGDKHISRCRKLHPCRYAKVSSQTSGTSLQSRPSFAGVVAKDINAQSGNEMGKNIAAKDFKGHNSQSPVESTELRPAALFRSPPPRRIGSGAQLSSEAMGYETARSCQEEWQGRVSAVAGAAPNGSLSERGGSSAPRILEVKMLSARGQSGNRPLDTLVF